MSTTGPLTPELLAELVAEAIEIACAGQGRCLN